MSLNCEPYETLHKKESKINNSSVKTLYVMLYLLTFLELRLLIRDVVFVHSEVDFFKLGIILSYVGVERKINTYCY